MATRSQRNDGSTQFQRGSDIIIALMGETGVGKTSFARRVTGDESIRPNHSITPERAAVASYRFQITSQDGRRCWNIILIDCPGFDNVDVSDNDITKSILEYLHTTYQRDQKLHGIIYIVDIKKTRVLNSAVANISMFKKLVGDEYYKNVVVATTFWDSVPKIEQGQKREDEMIQEDTLWAELIRRDSKIRRLGFAGRGGDPPLFIKEATSPIGTELDVLLDICEKHQPAALCVQVEMDSGLNSEQTSAMRELNEWRARARHHREQKEKIRAAMREVLDSNAARFEQDLEQECLQMNQEYEEQARVFALDEKGLRESHRRVVSLMQKCPGRRQDGTPAPESEAHRRLREQVEARRGDNDAAAQKLTNDARKRCTFHQHYKTRTGVVRCKVNCKNCDKVVNPGEKFFHCCSCWHGSHKYHQCRHCGNRCGKEHVVMFELHVAQIEE